MAIITATIVNKKIPFPCHFEEDSFLPFLQECIDIDLASCFGKDFKNDLVENEAEANYTALIAREDFKKMCAWFIHSRYVLDAQFRNTDNGVRVKTSQTSRELTTTERQEISMRSHAKAKYYAEEVKEYLDDNLKTFPLWASSEFCTDRNCGDMVTITKI